MKYQNLGNTNLKISKLGMGTMRLPISRQHDEYENAINLIRTAISQGINFFDIGTFYCHYKCEKVFGIATAGLADKEILFCAKNSSHQNFQHEWTSQLLSTLSLLNRKYLDIYFLHYLTFDYWESYFIDKGNLTKVLDAKEKGLFHYLGFSSHDSPEKVKMIIDTGYFSVVILPFNVLQQQYKEIMIYAKQRGMGVIAMSPLLGGNLANEDFLPQLAELSPNMANYLLNYVMSQDFIDCVLSGMDSTGIIINNSQLVDEKRLTEEEKSIINLIVNQKLKEYKILCTNCSYCMPCVQGIDIPSIINLYNQFNLIEGNNLFIRDYAALNSCADSCIACGSCVAKCPQQINIPMVMQKMSKKFCATRQ